MKNVILFVALVIIFLGSCKKEEIIMNTGIQVVTKDNPLPSSLSENTYRFWVEEVSFKKVKELSFSCEQDYDSYNQRWSDYYNCGKWRTMEVQLYYGTSLGVRWISEKTITLIMDEDTFHRGRDLSDQYGTISGSFSVRNNPLGINCMRINNFQEL